MGLSELFVVSLVLVFIVQFFGELFIMLDVGLRVVLFAKEIYMEV